MEMSPVTAAVSLMWRSVNVCCVYWSEDDSAVVITVKYLVSAPPPPLKHKFHRKVGGGRLLGILPFVQSIIQPLKVQVNTKRLEFKQKILFIPILKRKTKESW